MSTSPSWFDKDKFSRLVKKPVHKGLATQQMPPGAAAPKPAAQVPPQAKAPPEEKEKESPLLPEKPDLTILPQDAVPVAPPQPAPVVAPAEEIVKISAQQGMMTSQPLVIGTVKPPIADPVSEPVSEPVRAPAEIAAAKAPPLESSLPALPRRTAPLPALKPIFQYGVPPAANAPESSAVSAPITENKKSAPPIPGQGGKSKLSTSGPLLQKSPDLAVAWEKISLLNEDLRKAARDRDEANRENALLRDQLKQADNELKNLEEGNTPNLGLDKNLVKIIQERDALKLKVEDIGQAIIERDRIRGEYTELREQFEGLKQLPGRNTATGQLSFGLTLQLEKARQQLAERDQELESVRAGIRTAEDDLRRQLAERDDDLDGLKVAAQATEADLRKQLDERNQELAAYQSQASKIGGAEENLRRQLAERDADLDGLKVAAQATEVDLRQQLDERSRELASYQSQATQTGGAAEDLRRQLTERDADLDGLKAAAQATEADLRKQLDERNQELASHQSQASQTGNAAEDLRRQLIERDADIEGLKAATQATEADLRKQLDERDKEIETARGDATALQEAIGNLKNALSETQEQLKKATEESSGSPALLEEIARMKEEASMAQRGLALSQKALQETRDVLRNAQEASAQAKVSQDNLKKENSTLVQQIMLLQAQNDQSSRDLSAAKAKLAAKN